MDKVSIIMSTADRSSGSSITMGKNISKAFLGFFSLNVQDLINSHINCSWAEDAEPCRIFVNLINASRW